MMDVPKGLKPAQRDRGLLLADHSLTDAYLDDLWDWFNAAVERNVERELIFVKLVNSVRKPYIDQHGQHLDLDTTHGYTSYKCNIRKNTAEESLSESQSVLKALQKEAGGLEVKVRGASANITKELRVLQAELKELSTVFLPIQTHDIAKAFSQTPSPSLCPNRVAIGSAHRTDAFIQVDGSGVSTYEPGGAGNVAVQPNISDIEKLEVEYYPDNSIAFKSTCWDNVYLRVSCEGRSLSPGSRIESGNGVVNCQFISKDEHTGGVYERFRIHPLEYKGAVAIEPLAFPGRYLSINDKTNKVSLQGTCGAQETFYLIFVWW